MARKIIIPLAIILFASIIYVSASPETAWNALESLKELIPNMENIAVESSPTEEAIPEEAEMEESTSITSVDFINNALDGLGLDDDLLYDQKLEYVMFVEGNPKEEDLAMVQGLITKGGLPQTVISLYNYCHETMYGNQIMEPMYDIMASVEFQIDMNSAFDIATEKRHGSLSVEDVTAYFEKGLTSDDIIAADKLSKMGEFTITELLDKKFDGKEWNEIINETGALPQAEMDEPASVMVNKLAYCKRRNIDPATDVVAVATERLDKEVAKAHLKLRESGVRKKRRISTENDRTFKESAIENGVKESEIDALLDEGVDIQTIANASSHSKGRRTKLRDELNVLENEKIEQLRRKGGLKNE